jgi:hypothetical protein
MKRLLLAATIAFAVGCFGQTSGGTSSSQDQGASQAGTAHKGHKGSAAGADASGGTKTVQGCIAEKNGEYWLKSAKGSYHLMGSQDFKSHVGHEVKVTGTHSMGAAPGGSDTASASGGDKAAAGAGKKVHHLEVSSMDMVSEQCSMAGAKAGTKKGKKATSATSPS